MKPLLLIISLLIAQTAWAQGYWPHPLTPSERPVCVCPTPATSLAECGCIYGYKKNTLLKISPPYIDGATGDVVMADGTRFKRGWVKAEDALCGCAEYDLRIKEELEECEQDRKKGECK